MFGINKAMFANIARTGGKARRRPSYARIDKRSESTAATCALTTATFAQIFVIDMMTFGTCGGIAGTHVGTKASAWHRGSSPTVREGAESVALKRSA
jgi:hypothetical protein